MGTKKNKNPKMKSMEEQLSEAMQHLGEAAEGTLEARKNGAVVAKDKKRIEKAEEKANRIVQAAIEDTKRKIETGEFHDPDKWDYGDGDQSPLPSTEISAESLKLQVLWGEHS